MREKLRWPASTRTADDLALWRKQWAGAFTLEYRQVINDSKTLALAMAELAKRIRRRVNTVLTLESDSGHLRQMHKAFKDNLIADLSDDAFADMFAQTITYGLFTARASRSSGALVADNLADMVPSTNPFLKELLGSFLSAAGRARNRAKRVDFDELGINEVVTVLREVPMDAVLRSFNASKPGDDPVIHFYEDFLKAYDKAMRAKRGVFYTPSPVVQFIVRSVDEILKAEFGIEDGLASTITWGEMMARKPELKLPKFCTAATPFVHVLDPATGTGTFIVEVITQVHAHMLGKWAKQGKVTKAQWQPLWVDYVKQHLLPRLYAFELMMAPYAIAHMKIGLKLAETGYTFPEDGPRANVFLTNALEPAHAINPGLAFEAPMLAHEAAAANRVKEQLAATVVVGNPPYSGVSNNMFPWIDGLLKGQLPDGTVVSSYYHVDGQPLGERKVWLQDDYVKFIRFGQWRIESSGVGVLGYITNHAYFDNPTFRGMRASLLDAFDTLSVTDLHGSAKKGGSGDQDGPDENVFDIEQGVGVALLTRNAGLSDKTTLVSRSDLWGSRVAKYESLVSGSTLAKVLSPASPYYLFKYWDETNSADYMNGHALPDILRTNSSGIVTSKDHFVVSLDRASLIKRIKEFAVSHEVGDALLQRFDLSENYAWSATKARDEVAELANLADFVRKIAYRPFDNRYMFYHPSLVWRTREEVMQHMDGACLSLISCRQQSQEDVEWSLAGVTKLPIESCVISNKTKEINYSFPLWLTADKSKFPNLSSSYLAAIHSALNLVSTDYRPEDPTASLHADKIFHYIYAVLHSPAYRQRYAAFLRTDFPRIPIPGSRKVFDALAKLGAELVAWHLLEHPGAINIVAGQAHSTGAAAWFGTDYSLVKVAEKSRELADVQGTTDKVGKVYINATSGFANVHQSIWQHTIGGYQVLHKWLDDRRKAGRSLSSDDITHWLRVYAALQATQKLMLQVDVAIEANGGWPGAFSQNHPPPDAATLAAEQMAQKEQLKAQKKAASATKKRAVQVSPTGATSLFDDLEDLANAAGGPDRPKSRATPAKAAGGKNSGRTVQVDGLNDGQLMCAIRRALAGAGSGGLSRDGLIRSAARELEYARTSTALKAVLDDAVRRAVRRGIAENSGGVLTVLVKDISGYDLDHLKAQLLVAIRAVGGTCSKADAPMLLARALGFARTGPTITAMVESILRSLARAKLVASRAGQVSVLRAPAAPTR
ncbi:MAG: type ISP restriction/modification enzyme [Rhodoferax sp.]